MVARAAQVRQVHKAQRARRERQAELEGQALLVVRGELEQQGTLERMAVQGERGHRDQPARPVRLEGPEALEHKARQASLEPQDRLAPPAPVSTGRALTMERPLTTSMMA